MATRTKIDRLFETVITDKTAAGKLYGKAMPRIIAGFSALVKGRRIVEVGYMADGGEAIPVLVLDNGNVISAMSDDEGNSVGVLTCGNEILCQTSLTGNADEGA
jgi:hypothetical protein